MHKKIIEDIFGQANEKYAEYLNSEEYEKSFDESEMDFPDIVATLASHAREESLAITKAVLVKLFDSEDFKCELFKDMLKQAEEEKKRTGKNPFDI